MTEGRNRKRRLHLRLSDREFENLEMIRETHGVSLTQAIRTLIRAGFIQLGLERDISALVEKK